jgi:hypothetical protein
MTEIKDTDRIPIVDGSQYIDTAGNIRTIVGRTKLDDELVYSLNGDWYYRDTGEYYTLGPRKRKRFIGLVSLPPHLEIRFLEELDHAFRANNSADKLCLIETNLENIRKRLEKLRGV